ncbi:hypothetical protein DPMN_181658 [Dreissena polymorpha]|uniref:Uncharacterized protein n=1 Tax=Dreissena polymorpha TaxID=45954 RepID=A0A9D4I3X0_DREPO|nr:hypothetical protein DPMN_181658 [Dreissena polymorpha]
MNQYHKIPWTSINRSPGTVPLDPLNHYHYIPWTVPPYPRISTTRYAGPVSLDYLDKYH